MSLNCVVSSSEYKVCRSGDNVLVCLCRRSGTRAWSWIILSVFGCERCGCRRKINTTWHQDMIRHVVLSSPKPTIHKLEWDALFNLGASSVNSWLLIADGIYARRLFNTLQSSGHHMYHRIWTLSNSTFCPHSVFMGFVWIWEQTAIISLYGINWLVCITEAEGVYCAVRTGSLDIILRSDHTVYLCVLCGSENKQRLFPYTALTDWFL